MRLALAVALVATPAFADDAALKTAPWDSVRAEARGQTVNFFMWGGADPINGYVSGPVADAVAADGVTLNRVPVTDTADVVNLVLGEKQAGVDAEGAVDLVWINGANFRAMKQGDLAFCGYVANLPNAALVDLGDPAMANDFGVPVEGCEVPWNRAQFAFAYDSARTEAPPSTMADLIAWVHAHPGRFAYPAPPDFNGSAFVRMVFAHAAGGADRLLGPFDQARYDAVAPKAWAILNDLEPDLWREGRTYPTSITQLQQMFANREVDFVFDYDPAQFGIAVEAGTYPPTTRSYGLDDGTLANVNFVLIPYNSPHKAAAMVVANALLSGPLQVAKADPSVWGTAPVIDMGRTAPEVQAAFAALTSNPAVVPPEELARHALPELDAGWIAAIDAGWLAAVGR